MISRGSAWDIGPNLSEPCFVKRVGNDAHRSLEEFRASVASRFSFHQDELDIVLDNGIRFIWFSEEAGPIARDFEGGVGDFVPDDRREVIEADFSAMFLDGGVEGDNGVAAVVFSAREADVADNADKPAPRDQGSVAMRPNSVQFVQEKVVVVNVAKLRLVLVVFFEGPIGRRGEDQMNGVLGKKVHSASVAAAHMVGSWQGGKDDFDVSDGDGVFSEPGDGGL